MRNLIFISGIALAIGLASCHKDKAAPTPEPTPCDSIQVSFANDIQPIFDNNCNTGSCHSSTGQADGRVYVNHGQIAADAEVCYSAMNHEAGFTAMPLGNPTKLPDSLLNKMNCWIQDGKPNN